MSQVTSQQTNAQNVTGERIAMLLFRHGLTQQKLALETGIGGPIISRKLRGLGRWYADELATIARRLDTSVAYLIGETDDDALLRSTADQQGEGWARWGSNPRPAD